MSYRDDVDALFHRARSLQAEVDRLRDELAARDAQPAPPALPGVAPAPSRPAPSPSTPPPLPDRRVLADAIVAGVERLEARTAWLPMVPPPPATKVRNGMAGVLVARLSEVESVLVVRVLELLADDDFGPAAVARNQAAFDQLAAELRGRLASP